MGNTALYEQGLERAETRVRPPWLSSPWAFIHAAGRPWGSWLEGSLPLHLRLPC